MQIDHDKWRNKHACLYYRKKKISWNIIRESIENFLINLSFSSFHKISVASQSAHKLHLGWVFCHSDGRYLCTVSATVTAWFAAWGAGGGGVPEEFDEAVVEQGLGVLVCWLGFRVGGEGDECRVRLSLMFHLQQSGKRDNRSAVYQSYAFLVWAFKFFFTNFIKKMWHKWMMRGERVARVRSSMAIFGARSP